MADWNEVAQHLEALYHASSELEEIFPGRKFTLDGHLVGSVGEVVAAYMFDLDLNTASTLAHDAISKDGRQVEIKLTQGSSVSLRHEPEHLIVLQRPRDGPVQVIYNGPGTDAWNAAGKRQSNGQCVISLTKLKRLQDSDARNTALPLVRLPPI